ncbi:oocyte zinc finger protein XlCOF8.4-like [Hyposmocoma kahamanoa]|uniref:oocyte zinc finger protein XlCOF8.4-like n=1 Tax=Hyposmocoma kahamanoa TaxID=1477025 RepID=UPI000E6D69D5|nr:oocyte zinc finger protein XlCOF8.4-like [Hyposmocoma kahamanoa]
MWLQANTQKYCHFLFKGELNNTCKMSHLEQQLHIKIESIKEEADAFEEGPLDTNINLKQEPVDDIQDEIVKKELYADHEIKEEIVIGPEALQHLTSNFVQSTCVEIKNGTYTKNNPYKCNICKKCFKTQLLYKMHAMRHIHKCEICNKCLTSKQGLKGHLWSHTTETPYKCDICNKYFQTKQILKGHLLTHSEDTPYKCDICNKCLKTRPGLKSHLFTHTEETPYKCDVCNICVTTKRSLTMHLLTHTKETPYKCNICNKYLTTKQCLKKHVMSHTFGAP